jgi:preprotein translocase subunit SecA
LKDRVIATGDELFTEIFERFRSSGENPQTRVAVLLAEVKESLFHEPRQTPEELAALPPEEVGTVIRGELRDSINQKAADIGEEVLNRYIQFEYLRNIDSRWQDHLENLESLREAVYLRAYSQKNPLLEYKLEGFQIFDDMLYEIKTAIARKIFRVRIQQAPEKPLAGRPAAGVLASHNAMGQFAAGGSSGTTAAGAAGSAVFHAGNGGGAAAQPQQVQVKRTVPKVGRNDLCPCGSGKKYKYCHGQ